MAPLIKSFYRNSDFFETRICVTGQHREMLDQVLQLFAIEPDIDLNIMRHNQDLFDITADVILAFRGVLREERPDYVFVHGDTTTAFCAALSCFYENVKICHIEAGLRTYDLTAPFPEEWNRQAISKLATYHFAPTQVSKENLINEGIKNSSIEVTGNTVIDALHQTIRQLESDKNRQSHVKQILSKAIPFNWATEKFILITGHRRENLGDGFLNICKAIKAASTEFPEVQFVYPVHLNPQVRAQVHSILLSSKNIHLIEPLTYEPFVYLLEHCHFVLTDSGGIQEEAPGLGKPVLVMRETSERPEAIDAGIAKLVGASELQIVNNIRSLLTVPGIFEQMSCAHNPYGDGKASDRIINFMRTVS